MGTSALFTTAPDALITDALKDLRELLELNQAGALHQDVFFDLVNRMRRKLKAARIASVTDMSSEEMIRVGGELGRLLDNQQLRPAASLPAGVTRARYVGHLSLIDGGLSAKPETQPTDPAPKGAA